MIVLSKLERAVLTAIAEQNPAYSSALRQQIVKVRVADRKNTGHGFYTTLIVDGAPRVEAPSPLGDIGATIEGVEQGMGFMLWLTDGCANSLEGYTYNGDLTGLDLTTLKFSEVGPRIRS